MVDSNANHNMVIIPKFWVMKHMSGKDMKKKIVETPNGSNSFYSEFDADHSTIEGRIEWFCTHFEVEPPKLTYDPEAPGALLLTEDLIAWAEFEGVSLDWLICGHVSACLSEYRKANKLDPQTKKFAGYVMSLDGAEQRILLSGLKASTDPDADFEQIIQATFGLIAQHRQSAE
jgi:hypothetical protein